MHVQWREVKLILPDVTGLVLIQDHLFRLILKLHLSLLCDEASEVVG